MTSSRYTLHENFSDYQDFLSHIKEHFQDATTLIHDARNQLKIVPSGDQEFVVKAFRIPNIINQFVYGTFRASKAKKSYEHSLLLQKLSITCPSPVAYIEFYHGLMLQESYFVSERVNYDFTIREPLLDRTWPDHDKIFTQFGLFSAQLHQKGILHKDYSPGNILITKQEDGDYRFDLVDINRMRFGALTHKEKMQNLSKLWASEEDMKIIATAYARFEGLDIEKTVTEMITYDRKNKQIKTFKRRLKGQK